MKAHLYLACGHAPIRFTETPLCSTCGETRVVRTSGIGAPRIRGVATGPHVETVDLPAHVGVLPGVSPMASAKERIH